jgi:hypothetical protein
MTSDEAPDRLRELLRQAGVNIERPTAIDVDRTWAVVRQFAQEPVDDAEPREAEGDGILAQYGVFAWDGPPHFELDMTRQFSFADEDGEYSHMTQLQCTFQFAVTDELRALGEANLWSFDLTLGRFFERALAMPGFRGVRELGVAPLRLVVEYDEVRPPARATDAEDPHAVAHA